MLLEADLIKNIDRLRQGNEDAFRVIYHHYHKRIAAFCLENGLTMEDSKEVVQDTFVKLWEKKSKIESHKNFEGYFFKIAKNQIVDRFRKFSRQRAAEQYQIFMLRAENETENTVLHNELETQIQTTLDSLPQIRRLVFHMSRIKGKTNRQIANELDISIRTVETHISKALQTFNEVLGPSRGAI